MRSTTVAKHIWCLFQRRRLAQAFLQNKTKAALLRKRSCCAGLTLLFTGVTTGFCVCTSPFLQLQWVTTLKLVGLGNSEEILPKPNFKNLQTLKLVSRNFLCCLSAQCLVQQGPGVTRGPKFYSNTNNKLKIVIHSIWAIIPTSYPVCQTHCTPANTWEMWWPSHQSCQMNAICLKYLTFRSKWLGNSSTASPAVKGHRPEGWNWVMHSPEVEQKLGGNISVEAVDPCTASHLHHLFSCLKGLHLGREFQHSLFLCVCVCWPFH